MAFKKNDIRRISNVFSCSENEVKEVIYMSTSYLKKNIVNTYTTARTISIVIDKLQRATKKKDVIKYPDFNMKHSAIKKHRADIVVLYEKTIGTEKGWGWVSSELKSLYNIVVSRQTIRTYILKYQEWKLWQI